MTTSKRASPAGIKIVRKRLADGTIKEYAYKVKPKPVGPSRFTVASGNGIRDISIAYTKSPEFKALSATWQEATRYYLGILENKLGWMTVKNLADPRARRKFYEMRDSFAEHPHKADKLIGVLGTVMAWAYERTMLPANQATGIDRLARGGQRADKTWSDSQIAALLAVAPPDLARLVRLGLLTTARLGDLRALRWSDYADGWLTFTPQKTRKMVPAPVVRLPVFELPPLADLLKECGPAHDGTILTTEARGIPWTTPNFNARWKAALARAELLDADRHFHDIRGTGITRLLEAGCSDAETASISGHSIGGRSMLRAYAARSDSLAIAAYRKLNEWLSAGPRVVSFPTKRETGGNRS